MDELAFEKVDAVIVLSLDDPAILLITELEVPLMVEEIFADANNVNEEAAILFTVLVIMPLAIIEEEIVVELLIVLDADWEPRNNAEIVDKLSDCPTNLPDANTVAAIVEILDELPVSIPAANIDNEEDAILFIELVTTESPNKLEDIVEVLAILPLILMPPFIAAVIVDALVDWLVALIDPLIDNERVDKLLEVLAVAPAPSILADTVDVFVIVPVIKATIDNVAEIVDTPLDWAVNDPLAIILEDRLPILLTVDVTEPAPNNGFKDTVEVLFIVSVKTPFANTDNDKLETPADCPVITPAAKISAVIVAILSDWPAASASPNKSA